MGTYPTKEPAAAPERFALPVRTVANELPQELSRLGGRNGHPVKAAAIPRSRPRPGLLAYGFAEDSRPTILAAPRG